MRRKTVVGSENLTVLTLHNPPYAIPELPEGHYVVCGVGWEENCELFYCASLEDMIEYSKAAGRMKVTWF